jgi:hypothetical protein
VLADNELPGFVGYPPSVDIDQAAGQADPATGGTVEFEATFSEAVSGFTNADVTIAGTAGATTCGVTGPVGNVYTLNISGMTTSGTVVVSIAANVCTAVATGLGNTASTHTDNSVTWSNVRTLPVAGYRIWYDPSDSATYSGGVSADITNFANKGNFTHDLNTENGGSGNTRIGTATANGHDLLTTDGTASMGAATTSVNIFAARALTMFIVAKVPNIGASGGIIDLFSPATGVDLNTLMLERRPAVIRPTIGNGASGFGSVNYRDPDVSDTDYTNLRLYTIRVNTSTFELRINGSNKTLGGGASGTMAVSSFLATNPGNLAVYIGSRQGTFRIAVDVGDVVVYDSLLSTTDRDTMESALIAYWGI